MTTFCCKICLVSLSFLTFFPGCRASTSARGPQEATVDDLASQGGNLIKNSTFEGSSPLPWMQLFLKPAQGKLEVQDGAACTTIENAGQNNWDVQVRHREMVIEQGHSYSFSYRVWATKPTLVRAKVGMSGPPYAEYTHQDVRVTTEPQTVSGRFSMELADDPTAEFAFHMGGSLLRDTELPVTICLDDVELRDPEFTPSASEDDAPISAVRVNQVGYFPFGPKVAALVSSHNDPLEWSLRHEGKQVASGETHVLGMDEESGDPLHLIDFSSVTAAGDDYVLSVGEEASGPFSIRDELYSAMKYDALRYFYHNRSGIEIAMPYATNERWTRPAGHAQSDKTVACAKDAGCEYELDVSGGWYDAGDHGKYVVNGGIAVWTLMNQYERFSAFGSVEPFGDGKMNLPESGNGTPDLLDEARWEVEFLLKMQVPEGQPRAGMVHHKMHDTVWTGLGLAPHEAEKQTVRELRPVSTAATLNMAAAAAQAARLFASYDQAFSKRCLDAAERAWAAAKDNPPVLADPDDGQDGGGPYEDDHLDDEFYWAAAELYVTTKKPAFLRELQASKYYQKLTTRFGSGPTSMSWQDTSTLGTISLSVVEGALTEAQRKAQQELLVERADDYLALIASQGYRLPFSANSEGKYPWGSNSFVLNNMMILAYAYDFTKAPKYRDAVILGMDYLLGRNAMGQSYVTGYGENPLKHPHHRFWSQQARADFPPPPPGVVSGGPNSGLQDDYVRSAGLKGCAPQKCFADHIDAWSVNEITINWNAPFSWVTAFLDENPPKPAK